MNQSDKLPVRKFARFEYEIAVERKAIGFPDETVSA